MRAWCWELKVPGYCARGAWVGHTGERGRRGGKPPGRRAARGKPRGGSRSGGWGRWGLIWLGWVAMAMAAATATAAIIRDSVAGEAAAPAGEIGTGGDRQVCLGAISGRCSIDSFFSVAPPSFLGSSSHSPYADVTSGARAAASLRRPSVLNKGRPKSPSGQCWCIWRAVR
jgi:hypothetical protein